MAELFIYWITERFSHCVVSAPNFCFQVILLSFYLCCLTRPLSIITVYLESVRNSSTFFECLSMCATVSCCLIFLFLLYWLYFSLQIRLYANIYDNMYLGFGVNKCCLILNYDCFLEGKHNCISYAYKLNSYYY